MASFLFHKFPAVSFLALSLAIAMGSCSSQQSTSQSREATPTAIAPTASTASTPTAEDRAIPRYDHIFVILEENKTYGQIIDNPNAPNINRLKQTYGIATNYYGVVHPSQANYVSLIGGSTFGIHDDDAFYCQAQQVDPFCAYSRRSNYANHTIAAKSLVDQLEAKGLTWKGYFESIPAPGSKAIVYPSGVRALYAAKHNGFINFKKVQDDPNLATKMVGMEQLKADLQGDRAPNYSHVVFNQCNEMHGLYECPNLQQLIKTGDAMVGQTVELITHSKLWSAPGHAAIVITWDEDNNPPDKTAIQGCCGYDPKSQANFGGGHIATLVITNHGPRGVVDATPYNHYSLLRTTEDAFGIYEYLNQAGNTSAGVKPMTALFALPGK